MNKTSVLTVLVVLAAVATTVLFYFSFQKMQESANQKTRALAEVKPRPKISTEPPIRFPVKVEERPLPPLSDSDSVLREALNIKLGAIFGMLVNWQDIVRRVVVAVDNLPRQKLALRLMPLKSPAGRFSVVGKDGDEVIDPRNQLRYAPYVTLVQAIDTQKLLAVYIHFYPLFQQAYRELGYPKGYFNDRVVDVIDNLLATPEIQERVGLVRPKVYYEFADAGLEALPAGQKMLVRIGTEHAAKVKAKLREIRIALTAQRPMQ